jgi:hypothetical protein
MVRLSAFGNRILLFSCLVLMLVPSRAQPIDGALSVLAQSVSPHVSLEEADEDLAGAQVLPRPITDGVLRPTRLVIGDDGKVADLSIADMLHNLSVLAGVYRNAFADLKVTTVTLNRSLPIFSLYKAVPDLCLLGLNTVPTDWRRVVEKLNLFTPDDDLLIFEEVAMAHEVGHCMAVKHLESINRRWGIPDRELFADIFALIHVQLHMEHKKDAALDQLLRFRAGGPPDPSRPQTDTLISIHETLQATFPTEEAKDHRAEFWVEFALGLMPASATSNPVTSTQTDTGWFMQN